MSPSAETLRRVGEFKYWLANSREESTTASKEVTASFNLDALKTAASAVIGQRCLGVFLIAEGLCLHPVHLEENTQPSVNWQAVSIRYLYSIVVVSL